MQLAEASSATLAEADRNLVDIDDRFFAARQSRNSRGYVEARRASDQSCGAFIRWRRKNFGRRALFEQLAIIQHDESIAVSSDHAQIVRDQKKSRLYSIGRAVPAASSGSAPAP